MKDNVEVHRLTTIKLHENSFLSSYLLTNSVELTIRSSNNEQFGIEFTPAQIPVLEKILNDLRTLAEKQLHQKIDTLSEELQHLQQFQYHHQALLNNGSFVND